VLGQWRQGILYPRWASLAHFGYGEPRFVFYPPASWTLGAALSAILPWTIVPSVFIWIALVAAGISMFVLVRQWLARRDAIFAAVFYAVNPYHLVIVYWRSALAELLASCLLPLLVMFVLRLGKDRRAMVGASLVLSASWLINAPAAVMIHYSFALLVAVIACVRRAPRILLTGVASLILGAALAAFYLVPAIYEQRWAEIAQAVSAGSRPLDNFLFIHTTDVDHDAFNRLISWLAVTMIFLTVLSAWTARRWRERDREIWCGLLVWAGACSALMFSVTAPAWNLLPKLEFMQFPWRWMLCLSVVFTLLVAFGIRRWAVRGVVYTVTLCVIVLCWHRVQAPWWDNAADLREMEDNVATGAGYEGTDEYAPKGSDPTQVDKDARKVTVEGAARGAIRVFAWRPEAKVFTADMSAADNLALRLFNYPAWRVEVNGRVVEAGRRESTGQMLVPVEAGANRVEITFIRTWDRIAGGVVSVVAWLGLLLGFFMSSSAFARSA